MKSTKGRRIAFITLGVLIVLAMGLLVARRMPTLRRADPDAYYETDAGIPIIFHTELSSYRAIMTDGQIYLPLSFAADEVDCRFYFDEESGGIRYILPDDIMTIMPDEPLVTVGEERMELAVVPLKEEEGTLFLSLSFLTEMENLTVQVFEEPERIWILTDEDEEILYVESHALSAIRTLPANRAPVLERGKRGEIFVIAGESEDWYHVVSEEGNIGYVKKSSVGELYEAERAFTPSDLVYQKNTLEEEVLLGFDAVYDASFDAASFETMVLRADGMNVIVPTFYTIADDEGHLISRANADYVNQAHESGRYVWALVENINADVDEEVLFGSLSARTCLIEEILAEAETAGYDGINLDIESLSGETMPHYLQFVRELALCCKEKGLILSCETYVPTSYNTGYNIAALADAADYVIVMGYDESYVEPGPNSSLSFVSAAAESIREQTDESRVIFAIPFYARLWSTDEAGNVIRKSIGMEYCNSLMEDGNEAVWQEETGCYYGRVTIDGIVYQIWYEELTSMKQRLDILKDYSFAGLAGWCLGLEDPDVWQMMAACLGERQ